MKTVLFVTTEENQRALYEPALKRHLTVVGADSTHGAPANLDAVVYDRPKRPPDDDLHWLGTVEVPVVVLTPDQRLHLPEARRRAILAYPVRMDQILDALAKLGVCPGGVC
jgi:hypothetical protein